MNHSSIGRRAFLRRLSLLSAAGVTAPWASNLALIGDAAAQSAASDYKALVCVFMYGGNDHANTLVPVDSAGYQQYQQVRTALALPLNEALQNNTLNPVTALPNSRKLAFAPGFSALTGHFNNSRKLAVISNVGPLVSPITADQYRAKSAAVPPQLFSHNDQQVVWQTGQPEGATSGWGGHVGDLIAANNGKPVFTTVSIGSSAPFLSGRSTAQYQISSKGPVGLEGRSSLYGSAAAATAYSTLMNLNSNELFTNEYGRVLKRSLDSGTELAGAIAQLGTLQTVFPTTDLGQQLKVVAQTIAARSALGSKRQIFFVSMGGFDNHNTLLTSQPVLLSTVAAAMNAFYAATVEMGVANNVTSFTASDFGRGLPNNGDGSDHGWGGHHLVLGGAVKGGQVYGDFPSLELAGPNHVDGGRMLPQFSVDQYAATLAAWFGVSATDIEQTVVPNLKNFSNKNLGFI
jgi:uncharacterized protein (DUF1501 family)